MLVRVARGRDFWRLALAVLVCYAFSGVSNQGNSQEQPPVTRGNGQAANIVDLSIQLKPWQRSAYGVTRQGSPLAFWFTDADLDQATKRTRILFVAQLDGVDASGVDDSGLALINFMRWFASSECPMKWRERFAISTVPLANPARTKPDRKAPTPGDTEPLRFPPPGPFYGNPATPQANYLWRWLGTHAPDLVVELRAGDVLRWRIPPDGQLSPLGERPSKSWGGALAKELNADRSALPDTELAVALGREAPSETGTIPAMVVEMPLDSITQSVTKLFAALEAVDARGPSPARLELQHRLKREPLDVLRQLNEHYGRTLPAVEYIPALALVGRLRLGELTGDATQRAAVRKIVEPYLTGEKPSTPKSGSGQSGHLIFTELARDAQGNERAALVQQSRVAADQAFGPDGAALASMPFHLEMSDAFFMSGPILAATGRLTSESRYFDACHRHLEFMRKLDLREDGLYRHSPLDETAWGRGNGFVALGISLCLVDWPADREDRKTWVAVHDAHLRTLLKHQDFTGCWQQVIDHPESYRELSSTCMITWAMARGVRGGWLDRATFDPAIRAGWNAILQRVASNGRLIDICTGTGKQKSLREYYDREAILGLDARGGAMSMMIAAEMAEYLAKRP